MKNKALMTSSSILFGVAGTLALFMPDQVLVLFGMPTTTPVIVLMQLAAAWYLAFALMNWIAKDSKIGGIYARPVSMGNFAHTLIGTLVLMRYLLAHGLTLGGRVILVVYGLYALAFSWLAFWSTGIEASDIR